MNIWLFMFIAAAGWLGIESICHPSIWRESLRRFYDNTKED